MKNASSLAYAADTHARAWGESEIGESIILPSGPWPGRAAEPERRLLAAVLEDAIACYKRPVRRHNRESRRAFHEAREWLNSHDRDTLFAFENVCDALGLDADSVRSRIDPKLRIDARPCLASAANRERGTSVERAGGVSRPAP
jgi:hypothetical protein